jgi:hypothetical protein
MLESAVQQRVRLELARLGALAWRNNSGACEDKTGRIIRYGLCNDSPQMNRSLASSDLIGVTPVVVTPDMVGRVIGVFTAVECKHSDWHLTPGDKRAQAQLRFIQLVQSVGGIGGFVNDPGQVRALCDLTPG